MKKIRSDYQNDKFLLWVKEHTDPKDIFLTNTDIYDPITFVGRQSFIGRPHYLWAYGVNPEERLKMQKRVFSEGDYNLPDDIKKQKINYIINYMIIDRTKNFKISQRSSCNLFYEDQSAEIYKCK